MDAVSTLSPKQLAREFADFSHRTLETFIQRYMPDGIRPGWLGGHRFGPDAAGDLLCLLGALHALGFREVAGLEIVPWLSHLLASVNGRETEAFYSYRTAETLLRFGPFDGNCLLDALTDAQRREIALACDTTHLYIGPGKLRALPNNYWGVLGRAEYARQCLGLLESDVLLAESCAQVARLLSANPLGYFDDSPSCLGRYDIYSPETLLFTEPIASLVGLELWERTLARNVELVSQLALENGASFAWGRSIGLHSLYISMEMAVSGLRHGMWREPARALSLATHAFAEARKWYADGLTNAHQHRTLSRYRRADRRVQMSLDCLIKLAEMAAVLRSCPRADDALPLLPHEELFPACDTLIPLDSRGAFVWSYRNRHLAFQFPIIQAHNADYVPFFRAPGRLENPVDTDLLCGVPRVWSGGLQYTTHGFPAVCEKLPDGLRLVYDAFQAFNVDGPPPVLAGRREVIYRVGEDGAIDAQEQWSFADLPEAIGIQFAETDRSPFALNFQCAADHHRHVVDVRGIIEWRSYWGELDRTHEVNFKPARVLEFSWRLCPAQRGVSTRDSHESAINE